MKEPFFSIVVPIYNVEAYLKKCVITLLSQSFKNYEIILVDDGSKDSSGAICDELYSLSPEVIKVIHKANGGLSDARNVGVDNSKGEYVIFVDSDDYWDDNRALEQIYGKLAAKPDVLLYGCKDYNCKNGKMVVSRNNYDETLLACGDKNRVISYLVQSGLYPGAAWLTVTRREFIIDNKIYFLKGYKSEDIDWLFNLFVCANSFAALNNPFYVYLKNRGGSITDLVNVKTFDDLHFIVSKWSKILHSMSESYASDLLVHLNYCYMMLLIIYARLPKDLRKSKRKDVEDQRGLLNYASGAKNRFVAVIIKTIGIKAGSALLRALYKLKHKEIE